MAAKTYPVHTVTASTPTNFITPASGKTFVAPLARLVNTGAADGTLTVTRTDASGTVLSTLVPGITLPAYTPYLLTAVQVTNPHKIMVTFSQTTLDCDAAGEE